MIESFCVHARQLVDFFESRGTRGKEARADDYISGYRANYTLRIPRKLYGKLNEQIAHLSLSRAGAVKINAEDRKLMMDALEDEARQFFERVDASGGPARNDDE